jgi:hypothetical protein
MFYSNEMISSLGYKSMEEFISDYVKKHKNCCIVYTSNGVYLDYDFDSN